MKTSITLMLDDEQADDTELRMLLKAALQEYAEVRTPVDRYVDKGGMRMSAEVRTRRLEDVASRVKLSQRLRAAAEGAKFERFEELGS